MPFDPQSLSLYPSAPGVYLMKDLQGNVLYVGKAKNVQSRLKQYFVPNRDEREMVPYLIAQVETIDPIVTLTEKDALILENTLIKKHQPKYNVLLKDDKTFISIMLTKHKWPMLKLIRYKDNPKNDGTYFGPYTNALAARQTLDLLLRLFPLRQCSDSEFANRVRPCLLYEIKRCIAPCVNLCSEKEYALHTESAVKLLKGNSSEVTQLLEKEIQKAADALQFEKAADLHRLLGQIHHVSTIKHIDHPDAKDCDAIGFYREANAVMIAQLIFRNGKVVGSEHFHFEYIASSDEEIISSFLLQKYQMDKALPKEIFLPFEVPKTVEEILQIALKYPKKGRKHDFVEMAQKNAKALFIRDLDARSAKEAMLSDLQESLQLTRFPRRIECIDTSHLSGTNSVAAIAAFTHGEKDKSRTRFFTIKQTENADDYTAMKEALFRHFRKAKEKNDFCDLLIVDGGKGQLSLALEVFEALGIASIDLIALSKEEARHDKGLTQEKIYTPFREDPIFLPIHSPVLFFLQKMRDEAHRFSIQFHRKKRSKKAFSSELDKVQGIGPVKKKNLLKHFGSVAAIKKATLEELQQVPGITLKIAETILNQLQQ